MLDSLGGAGSLVAEPVEGLEDVFGGGPSGSAFGEESREGAGGGDGGADLGLYEPVDQQGDGADLDQGGGSRRLDFRNTGRTAMGPLRKWWAGSDWAWYL